MSGLVLGWPLAVAGTFAAAWKLLMPGHPVGLVLPIIHFRPWSRKASRSPIFRPGTVGCPDVIACQFGYLSWPAGNSQASGFISAAWSRRVSSLLVWGLAPLRLGRVENSAKLGREHGFPLLVPEVREGVMPPPVMQLVGVHAVQRLPPPWHQPGDCLLPWSRVLACPAIGTGIKAWYAGPKVPGIPEHMSLRRCRRYGQELAEPCAGRWPISRSVAR